MPRETKLTIADRPTLDVLEDHNRYDVPTMRKLKVEADPLSMEVTPEATGAMKLAEALKGAKPGIDAALDDWTKKQDDRDRQQGESDAQGAGILKGDPLKQAMVNKSRAYAEGFLKLQGHLGAIDDAGKMQLDWDAQPNKDVTGYAQWAAQWYQKNTQGLSDPHYLAGYQPVMGAAIDQQKLLDTKTKIADQQGRTDAAFKETMKASLRSDANRATALPGPDVADIALKPGDYDASTWGTRTDGTAKGTGFLGVLKNPNGGVSSELTVGVPVGGKEMDIPTLVPTLTRDEVNQALAAKDSQSIPQAVIDKATAHAQERLAAGKSVFATPEDRAKPNGIVDMAWYKTVTDGIGNMVGRDKVQGRNLFAEAVDEMARTASTAEDVRAVRAAADLMKQKSPDGQFIFGQYVGKAEAWVQMAQDRVLGLLEVDNKTNSLLREKASEDARKDIVGLLVQGKGDDAMAKIQAVMADPTKAAAFNSTEMLSFFNQVRTSAQKVETEQQKMAMAKYLPDAHGGTLRDQTITDALLRGDISAAGADHLYSTVAAAKRAERGLAIQAQSQGRAFLRDPQFITANDLINRFPTNFNPDFDLDGLKHQAAVYQVDMAKAALFKAAGEGTVPGGDYLAYAKKLYENLDKVRTGLNGSEDHEVNPRAYLNVPGQFPNPYAAGQAYREGKISDAELDTVMRDFRARAGLDKPAKKAPK